MNGRKVVLGGLGLLLVGAVTVSEGSLSSLVSVGGLVDTLGNDYFLVAAVGGVALLVAMALFGRAADVRETQMPDAERSIRVPAPGDDLDERAGRLRYVLPVVGRETRADVRERLRADTVETVRRTESCSRGEAVERVDEGTWTDDPVAAAFVADDDRVSGSGGVLRALLHGETPFSYRVRRTADRIATRAGVTAASNRDGSDGGSR